MTSKPRARARLVADTKSATTLAMSCSVIAVGAASPGLCGNAEGASGCQPPASTGIRAPPSQGRWLDALRPAWPSWIASLIGEIARIASTTSLSAASLASLYKPRQPCVMRASGLTAVASTNSKPAPEMASEPRWVMCQALALPSCPEY